MWTLCSIFAGGSIDRRPPTGALVTENVRYALRRREFSEPTTPAVRGVPALIDDTRKQVIAAPFTQADAEDDLARLVAVDSEIVRADQCAPETGHGRAGCPTGQPTCLCGAFLASRPTPPQKAEHARGGATRADRLAPREPRGGSGGRSPAFAGTAARQDDVEDRTPSRPRGPAEAAEAASIPADTTKTAFPSLRKRPLTCDFKSRDDRI